MGKITFLIFLFLPILSIAQTVELEKEYINKLLQAKILTSTEITQLAYDWNKFNEENTYPQLPYNKEKQMFEFSGIMEFSGIPKEKAFDRIIEWVAISFGNVNSVLHYSNKESGKIIVKGFINLTNLADYKNIWGRQHEKVEETKCNFTLIVTIIESKAKIEFTNIKYERKFYTPLTYTYSLEIEFPVESLFPITSFPAIEWKRNVSLVQSTDLAVTLKISSLNRYINNYSSDYKF